MGTFGISLLAMEVVSRPLHPHLDVAELSTPECAVPLHEPSTHVPQPRGTSHSRRRRVLAKYLPHVVLRPIHAIDDLVDTPSGSEINNPASRASASSFKRSKNRTETNMNGSQNRQQSVLPSNLSPSTSSQNQRDSAVSDTNIICGTPPAGTAQPMLKILFWKRLKRPRMQVNTSYSSTSQEQAPVNTGASNGVVTEIVTNAPVATVELTDPATAATVEDSIVQQESASVAHHDLITNSNDSMTLPTTSPNIYLVGRNMYIGKLLELAPPKPLQDVWRQSIQPKLIGDLLLVLRRLPGRFPNPDYMIEIELCMSGQLQRGEESVVLKPTIWIRCGGKLCQSAVQQAVDDLSYLRCHPVHVTQHALRLASVKLLRTNNPWYMTSSAKTSESPVSMEDVVELAGTTIDWQTLEVFLEPLSEDINSACGLKLRLIVNGIEQQCTIGGLIRVNNTTMALTTGHAIWTAFIVTNPAAQEESASPQQTTGPEPQAAMTTTKLKETSDASLAKQALLASGWTPATLVKASYGRLCMPNHSATSDSDIAQSERNSDFALIQLTDKHQSLLRNQYKHKRKTVEVEGTSDDIGDGLRPVKLLSAQDEIQRGYLLDGAATIIDHQGLWETRKIQLESPLGMIPYFTGDSKRNKCVLLVLAPR